MSNLEKITQYNCGRCNTKGSIKVSTKQNSRNNNITVSVKKCNNRNCNHQYGLKELETLTEFHVNN